MSFPRSPPDDLPPEVAGLVAEAEAATGTAAVSLWEGVVRRADVAGSPAGVRMPLRVRLVRAAARARADARAFGPWAEVLAEADRDPDAAWVNWRELLWVYKGLASEPVYFTGVERGRVLALLDDYERRCLARGDTRQSVLKLRVVTLWELGEADAAAEARGEWERLPPDDLSDCPACEAFAEAMFAGWFDGDGAVVRRATPLMNGPPRCANVPSSLYHRVLAPLSRLGQAGEAADRAAAGLRVLRGDLGRLDAAADHLLYAARVGDPAGAARLFRRTAPRLVDGDDWDRLHVFAAAQCVFEALADGDDRPQRVPLPDGLPLPDAGEPERPSDLAARLGAAADALVAAFDRRNGNDASTRRRAAGRAFALGA